MAKEAHKKPVLFQVSPESGANSVSTFKKQDFDDSIFKKGYDAYIEKALRCPCALKANASGVPSCQNCGGTGWIFVNKRLTKAVMTSMNKQTKFLNWSETDRGTVSITVRDDDKLSFMDRVTNLNLVSTYHEALQIREIKGKLVAFTVYPIIAPTEAFLMLKLTEPLRKLDLNTDFTIKDNKIILDSKFKNLAIAETTISIRYTHFPQYHVIDITRDAMGALGADQSCEDPSKAEQYAPMPIHAVARKAHFMLDEINADGESVYDNSYYPENSMLLDGLSPFSLEYWVLRATSQQLLDALAMSGNGEKLEDLQIRTLLKTIEDTIDSNTGLSVDNNSTADILTGYKTQAWFDANPSRILKKGQRVDLEQTSRYKIGDGVTTLQNLPLLGSVPLVVGVSEVVFGNATTGQATSTPNFKWDATFSAVKINGLVDSPTYFGKTFWQLNNESYIVAAYARNGASSNFGTPFGGSVFDLATNASNGMIIGTISNAPVGIGANNQLIATFSHIANYARVIIGNNVGTPGQIYVGSISGSTIYESGYITTESSGVPLIVRIGFNERANISLTNTVFYGGDLSTDYGVKVDSNGFRIGRRSTLSSANSHPFEVTNYLYFESGTYTIYTHPGAQSFVQISTTQAQMGHYSTRASFYGQVGGGNPNFFDLTTDNAVKIRGYATNVHIYGGSVATDYGVRVDATGFRVGTFNSLGNANTYVFQVGGLTYKNTRGDYYLDIDTYGQFGYRAGVTNKFILAIAGGNTFHLTQALGYNQIEMINGAGTVFTTSGYHRFNTLSGISDRLVESNSNGNIAAKITIKETFIVDSSVISLLENTSNWTAKEYAGTVITGTQEGDMHFDADYWFLCVSDNNWIRVARA